MGMQAGKCVDGLSQDRDDPALLLRADLVAREQDGFQFSACLQVFG